MTTHDPLDILLIEDNERDAALYRSLLEKAAEAPCRLNCVARLHDGLDALRNTHVNAVVLDLGLPDGPGGVATVRAVTQLIDDLSLRVPVVVLTGETDKDLALEAVREGAQEYLLKTQIDEDRLIRAVRYAIERFEGLRVAKWMKYAEGQFHRAQEIQQLLFPKESPVVPGYDFGGRSRPANMTGGDYFDFFPFADGAQGSGVADVSGHDFASSFVVGQLRSSIRAVSDGCNDLGQVFQRLHRAIAPYLPPYMFASLFLAKLEPSVGRVDYTSAGHCGWLIDERGDVVRRLESQCPVISAVVNIPDCPVQSLTLEPGQSLLIFTDGIEESAGSDGLLGREKIMAEFKRRYRDDAQLIVDGLIEYALNYSLGRKQNDDMTIVLVKRDAV